MPDPWYPHARRNPGIRAGYTSGVISPMDTVKCHFTAGTSSEGLIRNQGLAQFLISRNGEVVQFAEANAVCWDSGEWNDDGPGIEIEFYQEDEIFTDAARTSCAGLVKWLSSEWGIPLHYYDGLRIPENTYRGFISHRALIQSQPHGDFWPITDWEAMVGENKSTARKGFIMWWQMLIDNNGFPRSIRMSGSLQLDELAANAPRGAYAIHQEALDSGWPIVRTDNIFVAPGIKVSDHLKAWNDRQWK